MYFFCGPALKTPPPPPYPPYLYICSMCRLRSPAPLHSSLSVCLHVSSSVCVFIYLFFCYVCLFVCLTVWPSIYLYPSVFPCLSPPSPSLPPSVLSPSLPPFSLALSLSPSHPLPLSPSPHRAHFSMRTEIRPPERARRGAVRAVRTEGYAYRSRG